MTNFNYNVIIASSYECGPDEEASGEESCDVVLPDGRRCSIQTLHGFALAQQSGNRVYVGDILGRLGNTWESAIDVPHPPKEKEVEVEIEDFEFDKILLVGTPVLP